MERKIPSREQVEAYLRDERNWGRWKDRPGAGAVNLVTDQKRIEAASLVRSGKAISLARPLAVEPSHDNVKPVDFYMKRLPWIDDGGAALDYISIFQHGLSVTHLDALCHMWDKNGIWEDKDPDEVLTFDGATFGGVEEWSEGIMTRGVLLDVPRHRGQPYVDLDSPVHGWELEDIAAAQGVGLTPGDAAVVYCGREAYEEANGNYGGDPVGSRYPGLHASCLPFLRGNDLAMLIWDMEDASPNEYGIAWTVHGAIHAYGMALIDCAALATLAQECARVNRYEFMLTVNPLILVGGTGSPVNPIAVL